MNDYEVSPQMDAILSIDASKGNSIIKQRGFAISPTAMQGYVLRVSPDLVKAMESTTGHPAVTFPIFSAIRRAALISGCTKQPTPMTKPFIEQRTASGDG